MSRRITGPCTHTTCSDSATRLLTNGEFRHHLTLDAAGTTAIANAGAPVCDECFRTATGRHPCSTDGCLRTSAIAGHAVEHVPHWLGVERVLATLLRRA
jgi:hypothetical protein